MWLNLESDFTVHLQEMYDLLRQPPMMSHGADRACPLLLVALFDCQLCKGEEQGDI